MTPEDWETIARAEVRKAQGEFHARLAAIRSKVESHGADSNAFFLSTALFDGPLNNPRERRWISFASSRAPIIA